MGSAVLSRPHSNKRSVLERYLQSELQLARIESGSSLTEVALGNAIVGCVVRTGELEVGVVQRVKCFRAEFHSHSLCDLDLLVHRGIPGDERRTDKGVASQIADATEAGGGEEPVRTAAVRLTVLEPRAPAVGPLIVARAIARGGRVRAVVALVVKVEIAAFVDALTCVNSSLRTVTRQIGEFTDVWAEVRAGLAGDDSVEGPSTQDVTHEPLLTTEEWQLPDIVPDQSMPDVKNGVTPVDTGEIRIAGVAFTTGRSVRTGRTAMPGGTAVNGMAVGVIEVEGEAMAGRLFQGQL